MQFDAFHRDLRLAWRLLARSPGFTAVAVLTIGVGIGASSAIFNLLDMVFFRSLPVRQPEQLVLLDPLSTRGETYNASYPLYQRLREGVDVFTGVAAAVDDVTELPVSIGDPATWQKPTALVHMVTGEYFSVLGAFPDVGRTFTLADNQIAGSHPVAVLSHRFWRRQFNGDAAVVGKTIMLAQQPFTVVGVMRAGFFGDAVGKSPDIWVPLMMYPVLGGTESMLGDARVGWLRMIARLRPGQTREAATAELQVWRARLNDDPLSSAFRQLASIAVSDGRQGVTRFQARFSLPLRIMGGLVAVLLAISCANVSGLLLARLSGRQREVAVRLSIGAGRGSLVRQFLTEGVLLAGLGGLLSIFIAWWGSGILLALASSEAEPILIDVSPNLRTLFVTGALFSVAVLSVGLAPALASSRANLSSVLKATVLSRQRSQMLPSLVIAQVALSFLLLTGAILLVQTLRNLRAVEFGYAASALLQVRIEPEAGTYGPAAIPGLMQQLAEHMRALPGVASVSHAHAGFATGIPRTCCVAVEEFPHADAEHREVETLSVAPGFFGAVGQALLRGRDFTAAETSNTPQQTPAVAIVNEAFARRYFPGQPAIGKRFGWGEPPDVSYSIEIIGVAANAIYKEPRTAARPLIYFPSTSGTLMTIRAAATPESLITPIRAAIHAFDPRLEIRHIATISRDVERVLARERLLGALASFFGILAAALAALGLYALVAQSVASRTREIGIRMAIGARQAQVLRNELGASFRFLLMGAVIGVVAVLLTAQLISPQLFEVSAGDPRVLGSALAVLTVAGGAAAYLPARRASMVDPNVVLKFD